MRALQVSRPGKIALNTVEKPTLEGGKVIVKVAYSALCSSDIKLIKGDYHGLVYPCTPGHEWSGTVVEACCGYEHFVGKNVVIDILSPCQKCELCREGHGNLCTNMKEIGISLPGGFAEYAAVDANKVIPIPDMISLKDACIVEPLAVAYNAIKRIGGVKPADKVAVLGSGAVGLILLSLAKLMGASTILVADYVQDRLDLAKKMGATNTLNLNNDDIIAYCKANPDIQPNIVFDATGDAKAFHTALEIARPNATIGYVGYSAYDKVEVQPSHIMLKCLNIFGVLSPFETWNEAIEIIAQKRIDVSNLITHEFALEEYETLIGYMKTRENGIIRGVVKL